MLDDGWARYEARRYIAGLGPPDANVNIAGNQVFVTVRRDVPLSFLSLRFNRRRSRRGRGVVESPVLVAHLRA
jgi:hypothetical protein